MCGIAGFVDFSGKSELDILKSMTDTMIHRGPDDSGYEIIHSSVATVGLGQRRLSIIDLSPTGHQPMIFQHYTIVFNGEIYNYQEVRTELQKLGYIFTTGSDTEVILKSFDKWGTQAVEKFIGMFVFAIFDKKNETLTLIRDRAGVKPLFYYFSGELFLFASELKAFHKHPGFIKELDIDNLAMFIDRGYFPSPHSIFKKTKKLLPGHSLQLNLKKRNLELQKYWDVVDFFNMPRFSRSEEDIMQELENLLQSSCEYRMVADVPVGIFLSGGYDSSLVTAILQKNRTEKLSTFTIGFNEEGFNESHHAASIAQYLGTDHHEYFCTYKDALELFPLLPEIYDEPFGDPSGIPTVLVSRLAAKILKVVNTGDGAEEVFAGYDDYVNDHPLYSLASKLSPAILSPFNLIASLFPSKQLPFYGPHVRKINDILRIRPKKEYVYKHPLLNEKIRTAPTFFDDFNLLNKENDFPSQMLAIDYKTRLLDDFLVKVDRATMSASLESREPLLDHRITEFMARVPMKIKCRGNVPKYLLKNIAYKYLPKELLDRPKMGFSLPIDEWLRKELRAITDYYTEENRLKKEGILSVGNVKKLKKQFLSGDLKYRESLKFKMILFFEMWREKWG